MGRGVRKCGAVGGARLLIAVLISLCVGNAICGRVIRLPLHHDHNPKAAALADQILMSRDVVALADPGLGDEYGGLHSTHTVPVPLWRHWAAPVTFIGVGASTVNASNPAQTYTVIPDTGSSTLIIPSCSVCPQNVGDCGGMCYSSTYSVNSSKCQQPDQSLCCFEVEYLDGSGVSGTRVNDLIWLDGSTDTAIHAIAVAQHQNPVDQFSSVNAEGIWGLADEALNQVCGSQDYVWPTAWDDLQAATGLPNVFTMNLGDIGLQNGFLTFGGADTTGTIEAFSWTPRVNPAAVPYYGVSLKSISVGDEVAAQSFGSHTVVDSGSTFLILFPSAMCNVMRYMMQYCPNGDENVVQRAFSGSKIYLPNLNYSQWPVLNFGFDGGMSMPVYPEQYLSPYGADYYLLAITTTRGQSILGNTFMSGKSIVFDVAGQRIGMARTHAGGTYDPPRCSTEPANSTACASFPPEPSPPGPPMSNWFWTAVGAFGGLLVIGAGLCVVGWVRRRRSAETNAALLPPGMTDTFNQYPNYAYGANGYQSSAPPQTMNL